jgi:RHS repeat-associated protein
MTQTNSNIAAPYNKNKYLYNGKELQDDNLAGSSLNWYDYRYRFYDPQICRFNSIDRLASDYPYKSPYDYAENRPVNGIDLDGLEWVDAKTGKGPGPVNDEYAKRNGLYLLPSFKTEKQSEEEQNQQVLREAAELSSTDNTATNTGTIKAFDPVQNYKDQLSAISPVSYSDGAGAIPSFKAGAELFGLIDGGFALTKAGIKLTNLLSFGGKAAKAGTEGGLNLFKWGASQTGKSSGWRFGDYMLHLPDKGLPKLNWKADYGALRREMNLGKPIFDSYRLPNGNLIPTGGFLNAERFTLQTRGWIYNPYVGAWMPPF